MLAGLRQLYNGQVCMDKSVENSEKHVGHSRRDGWDEEIMDDFAP